MSVMRERFLTKDLKNSKPSYLRNCVETSSTSREMNLKSLIQLKLSRIQLTSSIWRNVSGKFLD
jgi:hypothetical protein